MAELMGKHFKSIRIHLRCEVVWCMWGFHSLAELTLSLLRWRRYGWTHGKAFQIHQNSFHAVKMLGPCGLHLSLLNSWMAWWSKMDMAELMGMHSKSIRVHFTLWRCGGHVDYTLACWTHGWLGGVKGIWLNSLGCILNPSEFISRCADVGAMWAIP